MSIWDVLQAFVRRWYVLMLVVALALGASYVVKQSRGVYWSRAEVTFLAPTSSNNPNALQTTSTDLVITAGIVAKRINGNLTWNKVSDPAATIVGEGVYDGWIVRLPDNGGQWSRYYPRQVLVVEVSGPTEDAVRARQQDLFQRIAAELADMQQGVAAGDLITTTVVPDPPNVYYMSGSKTKAIAMIWLIAAGGATAAVVELERRRSRRLDSEGTTLPSIRARQPASR
ncbi:hypothetical protein [Cellulomonas sp. ICMP 17802]|uniref:hypothetical protein n=1 Tax=Cellulomonas sp. ICMP 17802 TaxID=3239199 RepID=UPI00351B52A5